MIECYGRINFSSCFHQAPTQGSISLKARFTILLRVLETYFGSESLKFHTRA